MPSRIKANKRKVIKELYLPDDPEFGPGSFNGVTKLFLETKKPLRDNSISTFENNAVDDSFEKSHYDSINQLQLEYKFKKHSKLRCCRRCLCCCREKNNFGSNISDNENIYVDELDVDLLNGRSLRENDFVEKGIGVEMGVLKQPQRRSTHDRSSLATLRRSSNIIFPFRVSVDQRKNWKTIAALTRRFKPMKFTQDAVFLHMNDILLAKLHNITYMLQKPVQESNLSEWPVEWALNKTKLTEDALSLWRPSTFINRRYIRKTYLHWMHRGQRELIQLSTGMFLELLPSLDKLFIDQLIGKPEENKNQLKYLIHTYETIDRHQRKANVSTSERWLAVIYSDKKTKNQIEIFRYLVIKLIFYFYFIAFEERDISDTDTRKEFMARQRYRKTTMVLPVVFTNGIPIGGCSMVYFLHQNNKIESFFKHAIHRWIQAYTINGFAPCHLMLRRTTSNSRYTCPISSC